MATLKQSNTMYFTNGIAKRVTLSDSGPQSFQRYATHEENPISGAREHGHYFHTKAEALANYRVRCSIKGLSSQ